MKRRLDLALALVHGPRILFLDEPTTGLDPQSRSEMWTEVAHLARDEGVTVFLTTQYLEEADVLADHVGIIDRGRIVARGTPEALKAEIGRPSLEVVPAERTDRDGGRRRARALRHALAGAARRGGRAAARRRRGAGGRGPRARRRGPRGDRLPAARPDARRRVPRPRPGASSRAARTRRPPSPSRWWRETPRRCSPRSARWRGAPCCRRCASRPWSSRRCSSRSSSWRSTPRGSTRPRGSPASRPTPTSTSRSPSRSSRARCSR